MLGRPFCPELIPCSQVSGPQGSYRSTGLLESSGGNLLSPSLYKGKNKLKVAGNEPD
jgi:hypothetical protein